MGLRLFLFLSLLLPFLAVANEHNLVIPYDNTILLDLNGKVEFVNKVPQSEIFYHYDCLVVQLEKETPIGNIQLADYFRC